MLVITRRVGEAVQIGRDIEVMVSYARDGRVRLAIKAPPEVLVARTELLKPKPKGLEQIMLGEGLK
jgi:carbon storage regulator CsrA